MNIYLKEKIGNPDLFTGRKRALSFFLKWIEGIKKEISMSTAILSRRKTGKTALLQRLYNLTFEQNNGVIPFYYEVKERPVWMVDFCQDFFLTFLYQYVAFKTRNTLYLKPETEKSCAHALDIVHQEHLEYLSQTITGVQQLVQEDRRDLFWSMVIDIPRGVAESHDERVVQMIDEFQYLNSYIYRDQGTTQLARDFAGGYMSTAEYKNAPLLIAGSWVGWLRDMLYTLLPGRFREFPFDDLPEDETIEMIYKYSEILDIPVAEEVVYTLWLA